MLIRSSCPDVIVILVMSCGSRFEFRDALIFHF